MLWLFILVGCALASAGGWYGYQKFLENGAKTTPPATGAAAANAGQTSPEPATSGAMAEDASRPAAPSASANDMALVSNGHIRARRKITVTPQVIGKIVLLNAEEGQLMKQGEILAKMEEVEFRADYDLAAAALELAQQQYNELKNGNRPEDIAQAEAEVGEAQARLVQLEADWKRKRDLRSTGIITPGELDLAQAEFAAMQKRVERLRAAQKLMTLGPRVERIAAAEAEVRRREAELVKAKWRLDNCTIVAPISGTILTKDAEEGNFVDPRVQRGSFSICEMANLADIEAELMIQERDVARVYVGQRCKIRPEAYKDRDYDGVVSRLMPVAQRSQGAIPVRVKITVPPDEVGKYLKPDMSARVTFLKD